MSAPTRTRDSRPQRGNLSPRSVKTWRDGHASFVHNEGHNLPTENLPPPTSPRFPFSLNATLATFPHLETVWIEDWSEDCQIATQPVNRPAALQRIAGEKFNPVDIGSGLIP
jgi:hypothetical protein